VFEACGGGGVCPPHEAAIAEGAGRHPQLRHRGARPTLLPGTADPRAAVIAAATAGGGCCLADGLAARLPDAIVGDLPCRPAGHVAHDKCALASATGALALDMESHIAARLAAARPGLPRRCA